MAESDQPDFDGPTDDVAQLLTYLATRDVPCPGCGYNLRGLARPNCPECGDSVSLTVTNYPSRLGGYSAGFIGLSLSLFLVVFLSVRYVGVFSLSILGLFAAIALLRAMFRWHRARTTFAALPRHKKQERVALCWGPAIFLFLLLVALQLGS